MKRIIKEPKINNYKLTAEGMYLNLCEVNPSNVNEKFKLMSV